MALHGVLSECSVEYTNGEELAAAAKAANRCPGSGTYVEFTRTRRTKCPVCGASVRLSSNARIFAHDSPQPDQT